MKASIKISRQNAFRITAKGIETSIRVGIARRAMAEAEQSQQELNDLLATLAGASKDIPEGHNLRFDPSTDSILVEPAENRSADRNSDVRNLPSINGRARATSASAGIDPSSDNQGRASS